MKESYRLEGRSLRHSKIEQDDVRLMLLAERLGLAMAPRNREEGHIHLCQQSFSHALREEGMVVRKNNAYRHDISSLHSGRGTQTFTTAPSPGREISSSLPPAHALRSAIPLRPKCP